MKKILYQLLYLLGFVVLFYFSYLAYQSYEEQKMEFFRIYPGIFFFSLTFVPIGLYFGLPQLLKTIKIKGRLSLNKSKLIIFGLPTLFLTLYPLFYWNGTFLAIRNIEINQFVFSAGFLNFFSFFFGFVLISSFEKKD
jgi:drug/metabolite transporter (DMT)-like permease